MFWAAIVGDQMIGPFRVEDGVKLNSEGYCDLLNANFVPWWKKHPARQRKLLIFMHDNAPSHASITQKPGWSATDSSRNRSWSGLLVHRI